MISRTGFIKSAFASIAGVLALPFLPNAKSSPKCEAAILTDGPMWDKSPDECHIAMDRPLLSDYGFAIPITWQFRPYMRDAMWELAIRDVSGPDDPYPGADWWPVIGAIETEILPTGELRFIPKIATWPIINGTKYGPNLESTRKKFVMLENAQREVELQIPVIVKRIEDYLGPRHAEKIARWRRSI